MYVDLFRLCIMGKYRTEQKYTIDIYARVPETSWC